jgi:hypothetical protein
MSAIHSDAASEDIAAFDTTDTDGSQAFLSSFADKPDAAKPSTKVEDEEEDDKTTEDTEGTDGSGESLDEDSDEENSGEDKEAPEADTAEKTYVADDGQYVKIKVGEEEKEVRVKDLTRLFGQEASLTQKSVEVSNARKAAETAQQTHATALNVLLTRATEQANPYRNIDWMAVSKDPNISAEAASALRTEAQRYLDNESFLGQNLNAFMGEVTARQNADRVASAQSCVKALTTEPTAAAPNANFIKGWNDKTYADVRAFSVKQGMSVDVVNATTDPAAIKLMHMAMLYARGASKVVTTKAVNKTPQKIVKNSSSPSARPTKATVDKTQALTKLKRSGTVDDAGAAFLASFAD